MDKDTYKENLSSILPEHDELDLNYDYKQAQEQEANNAVEAKQEKLNASQLARIKLREKKELEKLEKRKMDPTYKMTKKELENYELEQMRLRENIEEIEAIEESPEAQQFLSQGKSDIMPFSGATRRDVVKLLNSLNINLSLNLTRSDTYNLLSCLLTCNESQLEGLLNDSRVPIAIKIVIKRLLSDAKEGNMTTVEKLWDRIFGKADKISLEMPQTVQTQNGIIPNSVVSREAYVIIRDSIIGK